MGVGFRLSRLWTLVRSTRFDFKPTKMHILVRWPWLRDRH